jgi:peptide/nickel transport system substrate-binding protein
MKGSGPRRATWFGAGGALAAAVSMVVALTVTGAPAASAAARHRATSGSGVVSMAETASVAPNYLMPFVTGENNSIANTNLQFHLWPTLYTIGSPKHISEINPTLSIADPPVYSDGDTKVSITLKKYKWSDGAPLDARDLTFFLNLLKANKTSWAHHTPGTMPDNVVSWATQGTQTVVITLNHAYNPTWFTDNQLSFVVPLPQQAWDKESATGPDGTYDTTTAGAKAVFSFLQAQGKDVATYSTNPLWQVVDGPWKLKQFTSNGFVSLVPNTNYSGPDKPHISEFQLVPYTSATAEFNAVLSGDVTIGYVPNNDLKEKGRVTGAGYRLTPAPLEIVNLITLNYTSPVTGPLVKQLYIRKAMNDVSDQPAQVKAILSGIGGFPDYGPVPPEPPNPFMAAIQKKNPFNESAARKLLTSHGWSIPSQGPAVCKRPGTGSSDCGAGIARGKKLEFSLVYTSGTGYMTGVLANYKSDASSVGMVINLQQQPFNSIVGIICGTATCDSPGWQLADYGGNNFGSPYPEGSTMWQGHQGLDFPVSSKFQTLITATQTASANQTIPAMRAYDTWVVQNEPEVWQVVTNSVNAISNKVKNVWMSPVTNNVFPEQFTTK